MKNDLIAKRIGMICVGLLLGYSLAFMGFADYNELHKMFVFSELRMTFTFFSGLVFASIAFHFIFRNRFKIHRPLHKGTVLGGVIFGLGWALCGGCPSIPLVQIGQGKLMALASLFGMFLGVLLFRHIQKRYLHWDVGSCSS